jgi:hypothetical protein
MKKTDQYRKCLQNYILLDIRKQKQKQKQEEESHNATVGRKTPFETHNEMNQNNNF